MELHDLTAVDQACAIRTREISSRELTEHYLERTHRLNDALGAFAVITDELALVQADSADRSVRESDDVDALPLLLGVVVPVKDLHLYAGVPIRFGSAVVDMVADQDEDVAARLRAGGTVMTGKTSTPEFGLPAYTEPQTGPPARTPWDLRRSAGGSSGGAAAAVSSGLAPAAHGSDGGGSIRIPASACGLVGLKTSRDLLPTGPYPAAPGRLGVQGPLARTVPDAAALLDVMAGTGRTFLDATREDPGPLVIGRYRTPVIADVEVHPDCIAAYEAVTALLVSLGHDVVDVDVPIPMSAVSRFESVWAAGALEVPLSPEHESQVTALTRWLRDRGRALTDEDVIVEREHMWAHGQAALKAAAHVDIVLTPTLADLPTLVGALRNDADPEADFEAQKRFTPFTSPYNITGQPAVSLPLHWTDDGLPVGVQLVGRPLGEATLLRLSAQLERARPWAHRYPEVW